MIGRYRTERPCARSGKGTMVKTIRIFFFSLSNPKIRGGRLAPLGASRMLDGDIVTKEASLRRSF